MKSFTSKFFLVLVITLLVLSMMPTQSVSAGSKGQQIKLFGETGMLLNVTIKGTNQDGIPTTKKVSAVGNHATVAIPGYWWVGKITVSYTYNNKSYTCTGSIPKTQKSDWSWVVPMVGFNTCNGTPG